MGGSGNWIVLPYFVLEFTGLVSLLVRRKEGHDKLGGMAHWQGEASVCGRIGGNAKALNQPIPRPLPFIASLVRCPMFVGCHQKIRSLP